MQKLAIVFVFIFLIGSAGCSNESVKNESVPDDDGISETDMNEVDDMDTGNSGDSGDTGDTGIDEDDTEDSQNDMDTEDMVDESDESEQPDDSDTVDPTAVFNLGPYFVLTNEYSEGDNGAPRDFKVYEPQGATGPPVVHFLHGFQLKFNYYDDVLVHFASHGFIVVSSQSAHSMIGGDNTTTEAGKVAEFITWMKTDLPNRVSVTPDLTKFGVSGHSRGGKVTNRMLNANPALALAFFGLDPVDSAPPTGGDPESLNDPVLFKGKSMFLGAEKGPNGFQACAPAGENSVAFYSGYPSPSWHIIAAGVGHMDMIDESDLSACGMTCSVCDGSDDSTLNTSFRSYSGALMAAFFSYSLKSMNEYEVILSNTINHPFMNTLAEHK